jgi:hypothetical protein
MKGLTTSPEDLAEQAGGGIGLDLLNAILAAKNQGERSIEIQSAILKLQALPHPRRAAGGFAVALVNVLEVGIANLPKFKPEVR